MSKKNLARAAAVLGMAVAIAGPVTAANASAAELPPYDCALALPLLDETNPIVLGAVGCKDNTEKFVAEQAGTDTGVEVPDVPEVPEVPELPSDDGGSGEETPSPEPSEPSESEPTDDATGNADGPGKSEDAPGHDGDKGDEGNKNTDTIALAGSEAGSQELAETGAEDHTGPMLAAAGAMIAAGGGALALKRRHAKD